MVSTTYDYIETLVVEKKQLQAKVQWFIGMAAKQFLHHLLSSFSTYGI